MPFVYLGIPLGASQKRIRTREPVLQKTKEENDAMEAKITLNWGASLSY